MSKLAIIDGDGLMYQSSKEGLMESIDILDTKIQNIFDQTQATHYVIFISFTPYFRHSIDPNYKIGRSKYPQPLKWLKTLKSYLIEGYGAQSMKNVEADDLCAYWMNQEIHYGKVTNPHGDSHYTLTQDLKYLKECEVIEKVLSTPDKDLLKSIPGKHFNYSYKLEDKANPESVIKGTWIETDIESIDIFRWTQMIMGDATDGIKGIEGKGIKHAEKIYADEGRMFHEICLEEYITKYGFCQGIFEFQKNYRLLHLLDCDQDFMREVGVLPEFPVIKEIKKSEPMLEGIKVPNIF